MSTARLAPLPLVGIAALCLLALPGPALVQEQAGPVSAALTIVLEGAELTLSGDVSSEAHRARLLELIAAWSPEVSSHSDLQVRSPLPPGWSLVTEMTLRAVAQTYAATATVDDRGVSIRGYTEDETAWQTAAGRLRDSLLPDMVFHGYMTELVPDSNFEAQCLELLQAASARRRVEFSAAGGELGSNTYALLDELVEIAADCPAVVISVTGHTDHSGDAASNLTLSKARADAVVAYMVGKGIAANRFQTVGAGSTLPLVDETDTRSRAQNRRIEFAFSVSSENAGDAQ